MEEEVVVIAAPTWHWGVYLATRGAFDGRSNGGSTSLGWS